SFCLARRYVWLSHALSFPGFITLLSLPVALPIWGPKAGPRDADHQGPVSEQVGRPVDRAGPLLLPPGCGHASPAGWSPRFFFHRSATSILAAGRRRSTLRYTGAHQDVLCFDIS